MSRAHIGQALRGAVDSLNLPFPVNYREGYISASTGNRLDFDIEWTEAPAAEFGRTRLHTGRIHLVYWVGDKTIGQIDADLDLLITGLCNKTFSGVYVKDAMGTQRTGTNGRTTRIPFEFLQELRL